MEIRSLVKKEFVKVGRKEKLSSLIGKLEKAGLREALVFEGKKFLGIVENKFILKTRIDSSKLRIDGGRRSYIKKIPMVEESMDLVEAGYLMFNANLPLLVVGKKGKMVGIVHVRDLLRAAKGLIKDLKVKEVQITKVPLLEVEDRIGKAFEIMFESKVEQVPIVDAKGWLIGVICFHDLLKKFQVQALFRERGFKEDRQHSTRAFEAERPDILALPVKGFATKRFHYEVEEKDKVGVAIEMMVKRNIRSVVVVRGRKPVGLLTTKNLLRAVASLAKPLMYNIRFIGLRSTSLEAYQKNNLKKIAGVMAERIGRTIKNIFVLSIHIKELGKEGKRKKYSVMTRIEYPGKLFSGDEADWDIETGLRKALNNLQKQIIHHFHGDTSWDKPDE